VKLIIIRHSAAKCADGFLVRGVGGLAQPRHFPELARTGCPTRGGPGWGIPCRVRVRLDQPPASKIASMYSQQSADELVETIYRSITEFRGTKLLADDLTLVVLKTC
jgi:hypothetical protein